MSQIRDPDAMLYLEQLQGDAALSVGVRYGQESTFEELLEDAQRAVAAGMAGPGDDPVAAATRLYERQQSIDRTWWTRLEPASSVFYLDRAEQKVFEGFSALGVELPAIMPPVGTLPTFQFNALALPVTGKKEKYAIVFETGVFALTSALSRISSGIYMGRGGVGIGGQFLDLMFNQIVLGTSAYLHPDTLAVERDSWARGEIKLRPVFEAFWLAHEYAHVIKGHYEAVLRDPSLSRPELEKEADRLAFAATVRAFGDPVQALLGVGSLLHASRLVEQGYELIGEQTPPPHGGASHPTAVDRLESLFTVATYEMSPAQFQEAAYWLGVHGEKLGQYWAPFESALPVAREQFPRGWLPSDPLEERDALARFVKLIAQHIAIDQRPADKSKLRTWLGKTRLGGRS
jgi:hypothetical protein